MSSYLKNLKQLERPSRYIGDEFGIPQTHSANPRLRVLMGFPDVYEVGMSHLGFRLLHASLLCREDLVVERAFLPWPDFQAMLKAEGHPLTSLESQTPLAEFDLLGLSLQYELAFPSVLKMLDLAQIPRRTADRVASPQPWPLVLVGGSGALNPEPLSPFVDCFFLGEADQAIHEIVDCLATAGNRPRSQLLDQLSQIQGVYIPELVDVCYPEGGMGCQVSARAPMVLPIRRRVVEDLNQLEIPEVHLVPYCSIVHDRVTVEIQRGCSHGCRFCQAGFVTRPTRQRNPQQILDAAQQQLEKTGFESLSLLSLSAGDHPLLQEILATLIQTHGPKRVALSLPSLRTESLHPEVAKYISKTRSTTVTLAPEAATERLRQVINKGNSEQNLLDSVEAVIRAGYSQLKLYFMIGLPTETDEDVIAIAELAHRVYQHARQFRKHIKLTVSVSTFIPKPHTPFQWEAAPTIPQIRHKQQLLMHRTPRMIKLRWHDPGQSLVEAYLARADRRMAEVLDRLVTDDYLGLDAWTEHFRLERWEATLQAAHQAGQIPAPEQLLAPRALDLVLPWDHFDIGVTRSYFEGQRAAALAVKTRPDCSDGTCDMCGVCPDQPLHRLATADASVASHGQALGVQPLTAALPQEIGGDVATTGAMVPNPGLLRLWFHKVGRARLISHLELIKTLERACRRAELPLAFSAGYHPKPKFRFAPALPLGVESFCEFTEIGLQARLDPQVVLKKLAVQLPRGIILQSAQWVVDNIMAQIKGVCWRFQFPERCEDLLAQAQQQLGQKDGSFQRKGGKIINFHELIRQLRLVDQRTIEVECVFNANGTVRPSELLQYFFHQQPQQMAGTLVSRVQWTFDDSHGEQFGSAPKGVDNI